MKNTSIFFGMILTLGVITGCTIVIGGTPAPALVKPVVSIGSPSQGAQITLGQEVLVQAGATDPTGIVRIELWVDGMLTAIAQSPSAQPAYAAVLRWTPTIPGAHTLAVKAINTSSVASDPAAVAITVASASTSMPAATAPPTNTTLPPATAAPTNTPVTPAACANDSAFVEHVTVPDGTNWAAGQAFNKIWRVRNTGTCPWGAGYEFVFVGGTAMTTKQTLSGSSVAPGDTVDLLIAMTAPATPGIHSGQWRMRSPIGLFGATMNVTIIVLGAAQPPQQPPAGCPGAPVIASFDANPATITAGQQSTLSWGLVSNATSAAIDQGIGGVATPGSQAVSPAQTTTYTLTATGCGGTVTKKVTITVTGQAIQTIQPIKIPSADLEVTGLYADQWKVYIKIKNNGPDSVTNLDLTLSCNAKIRLPGASEYTSYYEGSTPIQVKIPAGQTVTVPTGISLDKVGWYVVTCTIQVPFDNLNTNKSNDGWILNAQRGP